jgi:RNA polymerase sigma-70 factor (ECF subfamily)
MDLEREIRTLRESGDLRAAVARTVAGYGPEVLGFLVTMLGGEDAANEAFSQACEDLWSTLPRFEGRSSMRTWYYMLARNAALRLRRTKRRRSRRRATLSEAANLAVERTRSRTPVYLDTGAKDRLAAIRESLKEEDRALLVLRIDRKMPWREIARVFADGDTSDGALIRVAARLRKRFQAVKDTIRAQAREAGLLGDSEP